MLDWDDNYCRPVFPEFPVIVEITKAPALKLVVRYDTHIFAQHIKVFDGGEELDTGFVESLCLVSGFAQVAVVEKGRLVYDEKTDSAKTKQVKFDRVRLKRNAPETAREEFNSFASKAAKFSDVFFES